MELQRKITTNLATTNLEEMTEGIFFLTSQSSLTRIHEAFTGKSRVSKTLWTPHFQNLPSRDF